MSGDTPRLYTTGRGYEEFRRPGRQGVNDGMKHHRLLAYAWGEIDSLDDHRHIDHRIEVRWLNIQGNLRAKDPTDHRRRTRRREMERRESPHDYCTDDTAEVIA